MREKKIESVRPIMAIEDDILISRLGAYSMVFELTPPSIFTLSESDYEKCAETFNRIMQVMPNNSIMHKMDVYYKKSSTPKLPEQKGIPVLKQGYISKFFQRESISHKCYLIFSKTSPNLLSKGSLNSLIFKKNFVAKELLDTNSQAMFIKGVEQIQTILNDSKYFETKPLEKKHIIDLCKKYESLNFLNDTQHTSDIYQDSQKLIIGNKYLSVLAVNALNNFPQEYEDVYVDPSYTSNKSSIKFSLLHPIGLGYKHEHIVNQVFIKETPEAVEAFLDKSRKDSSLFAFGKNINQAIINDIDGFNAYLNKGHIAVKYHANVLLYDTDKAALSKKENDLLSAFNAIKFIPNITHGDTLPLYWSCYPGNIANLGVSDQTFYLLDRQAAALNIYETNTKSSLSDFGILLNDRLSGVPIHVDISDAPIKMGLTNNRNKVIFGPSGSGKSFFTNLMLNNYLMQRAHVVTIDVGESYKRLCKLYNGVFFKYDINDPLAFNPFNVPKNQRTIEKKETLIQLIFTLWKKDPDQNTRDEYKILSDSIGKFFHYIDNKNKDIFLCFNAYFEFMQEEFIPLLEQNDTLHLFNHKSFFNVLSMFYKGGEYDYLLNSEKNQDLLNEQFIVFELDNIKDHKILFPVVTLMIMETFISKMRLLENTRKVILIEEAWKAISKEGMAEFMKYLYKTVRKHFGEAVLVTQEVDDILDNPIVKNTIIKNCGAKILLDMREYAEQIDSIQSLLSINDTAVELVMSLNRNNIPGDKYKEVFIALGNQGNVYGVNVSKEEYACYTTEKTEIEQIEKYYKQHQDMSLALKQFAQTL